MSLVKQINGGEQYIQIHINDIRENQGNFYDLDSNEIQAIAYSILKYGQIQNADVYKEELNDGKHYTLISGAKRYRAIKLLYESKQHNGYLYAKVYDKPTESIEEMNMICDANLQRRTNHSTLYKEILQKQKYYEYLCSIGEKPSQHKRDFIGDALGITGRQVSNIIREFEAPKEKNEEDKYKKYLKGVSKKIKKDYDLEVKITPKAITINCDGTGGINYILEKMGIRVKLLKEEEVIADEDL